MKHGAAGIISIGTAAPPRALTQREVGDAVLRALPDTPDDDTRRIRHYVRRLYRSGGITKRHTVLSSFPAAGADGCFIPESPGESGGPTTAQRGEIYRREAAPLAADAARKALRDTGDPSGKRITHLITVSCTGFYAPGIDIDLIRRLGLDPEVARFNIGFMGCYAALPALRMAKAFVAAQPDARVLVVSIELCSLHYRHRFTPDIITANALFGDGAAAVVVASNATDTGRCLMLSSFGTRLLPDTDDDMSWIIGDHGFAMTLSQHVPNVVGKSLPVAFQECCADAAVATRDVGHFALHPGGVAILDQAARSLNLDKSSLAASYGVLQSYGNMSSATLLFVLEKLMAERINGRVFAAAFGPGLCAEVALLEAR